MIATTEQQLLTLAHRSEPGRRVRVRIEGPLGYRSAPRPLPYVLVLHGFKGFMHWGFFPLLSRRLARMELVAISLNVSGSGIGEDLESFSELEAFARNTITRELEDIDLVRYYLRGERWPWLDLQRGALFGHSRGGGTALVHAAEHGDYRGLAAWAPVERFQLASGPAREEWQRRGFLPILNSRTGQTLRLDWSAAEDIEEHRGRYDLLAQARRLLCPALFVHGSADASVPPSSSEHLHAACRNARFVLVPGAGHTFGAVHPLEGIPPELDEAWSATAGFLSECLA